MASPFYKVFMSLGVWGQYNIFFLNLHNWVQRQGLKSPRLHTSFVQGVPGRVHFLSTFNCYSRAHAILRDSMQLDSCLDHQFGLQSNGSRGVYLRNKNRYSRANWFTMNNEPLTKKFSMRWSLLYTFWLSLPILLTWGIVKFNSKTIVWRYSGYLAIHLIGSKNYLHFLKLTFLHGGIYKLDWRAKMWCRRPNVNLKCYWLAAFALVLPRQSYTDVTSPLYGESKLMQNLRHPSWLL